MVASMRRIQLHQVKESILKDRHMRRFVYVAAVFVRCFPNQMGTEISRESKSRLKLNCTSLIR